jgi:hypothetical protein
MVAISLAACAQYDDARNERLAAAAHARTAADEANCQASGAPPGSPVYQDCRNRLLDQRSRETHRQNELANQMLNESALRPFDR